MRKTIVIAGISTEVGKTLVSAIFTEALQADYWKPVQSGSISDSDTAAVADGISNLKSTLHPESYLLKEPLSPHAAAALENIQIDLNKIKVPVTTNHLVIEMAGGLMVPLNDTQLSLDLLKDWKFPVVLVANYYLGSINHTLLSIDVLRRYAIPIHSIVFNGTCVPASKEAILSYAKVKRYFEIPALDEVNKETIKKYAQQIADHI